MRYALFASFAPERYTYEKHELAMFLAYAKVENARIHRREPPTQGDIVRICDILQKPLILAHLQGSDKEAVLREMTDHLRTQSQMLTVSPEQVLQALLTREQLGSTGVGEGVAIPHAKIPGLSMLMASFGRVPQGVSFDAIDYQPVKLIFMLLVPENSAGVHLKALARISRLLKNASFRARLLETSDPVALWEAFVQEDART